MIDKSLKLRADTSYKMSGDYDITGYVDSSGRVNLKAVTSYNMSGDYDITGYLS
jgi:hypothetical protein